MQVNCIECGHRFDLKDAYDDYEGYVKCSTCRTLLYLRAKDGQVLGVFPGHVQGQGVVAQVPQAAPPQMYAQPQMPTGAPAGYAPQAMPPQPMAQPTMAPAPAPVAQAPMAAPPAPAPAPAPVIDHAASAVPPPAVDGVSQPPANGWSAAEATSPVAEAEQALTDTSDAIGNILDEARSAAGLEEDAADTTDAPAATATGRAKKKTPGGAS